MDLSFDLSTIWIFLLVGHMVFIALVKAEDSDLALDEKAINNHKIDNLNILVYTILLALMVLTIWGFKHRRFRYLHETGLAVIYGLIVGAIIRYGTGDARLSHLTVVPASSTSYNKSTPPDTLWLHLMHKGKAARDLNKTYIYSFRGDITGLESNEIDLKATFDPEIFFNILLPPIIFHAGYSMKRKYFFRNLGTIMTFAFIGTTISALAIGGIMFGFVQIMFATSSKFSFSDCLYFGAIISATDPVTILAIFHDLHVDVNLYAMVFGESVLNDAVAIVLASSIQSYVELSKHSKDQFQFAAFLYAIGTFLKVFSLSCIIGSVMGCFTAVLTKFTRLKDFPLLESCLFVLMSYSTFLIAEVAELSGIVAVLFCGICQAHYTYNNLSVESRTRTKQLFELLNFLTENFIFCYIGVSMFTFPSHHWDFGFISAAFLAVIVSRAMNIYPLSLLLNLGRKQKIGMNFQHMLFLSGLRGAMCFALAIRNTVSIARKTMLTATSLIVIFTVIIGGGGTTQFLAWLGIPVGVEDDNEAVPITYRKQKPSSGSDDTPISGSLPPEEMTSTGKSLLARMWEGFDVKYMKPFLTHSHPTLLETLPVCCAPIARMLTSTEQLTQFREPDSNLMEDADVNFDREPVSSLTRHEVLPETDSLHRAAPY